MNHEAIGGIDGRFQVEHCGQVCSCPEHSCFSAWGLNDVGWRRRNFGASGNHRGEVREEVILLQIWENSAATSLSNTSPELDIENLKALKVSGKGAMGLTLLLLPVHTVLVIHLGFGPSSHPLSSQSLPSLLGLFTSILAGFSACLPYWFHWHLLWFCYPWNFWWRRSSSVLVVYLVDLETYEVVEQLVVCLQFLSCNLHQLFVSWVVFVVSTFESLNVVVGSFRHCSLCVPCSGMRFSCQNFLGLM